MTEEEMRQIQKNLTHFSETLIVKNLCDKKLWHIVQSIKTDENTITVNMLLKEAAVIELSQRESRPYAPVH